MSKSQPQTPETKPDVAAVVKPQPNVAETAVTPAPCPEPVVGTGYHPFDKLYVLAGINAQIPNDGFIGEVEASFVPAVSNSLFWFGGFAMIGTHLALDKDEGKPEEDAFRGGAGLEAGWRFLAVDGGYVYDGFQRNAEHHLRLRAGLAIADETFTNANATYSRGCCHEESATSCECDRTPAGMALFVYWAIEHAPKRNTEVADQMFGLSIKVGLGL